MLNFINSPRVYSSSGSIQKVKVRAGRCGEHLKKRKLKDLVEGQSVMSLRSITHHTIKAYVCVEV
jgi:hypothetical protein